VAATDSSGETAAGKRDADVIAAVMASKPQASRVDTYRSISDPILCTPDRNAATCAQEQLPYPELSRTPSSESGNSNGTATPRPWTFEELQTAIGSLSTAQLGPRQQQPQQRRQKRDPPPPPHLPNPEQCNLRHPLRLKSAYESVCGREPAYTTCHDKFVGTVDYIFYTPASHSETYALHPRRVLQPPPLHTLSTGMPCGAWPSDHVSLVCDFVITKATF
jgi:hypothetical protein